MNMNQNTKQVTFEQIKQDPDIRTYIKKADDIERWDSHADN